MKDLDDRLIQGDLALLDPTASNASGARERSITLQGKTLAGVVHDLLKIIAHHEGTGADEKCETLIKVNSGAGLATVATISAAGVLTFASTPTGLLTAAAAAAAYQPLDSDLTAIAALTTTSFGRAVLALADAAALRTAAGLGSVATLDVDIDDTMAANSDAKVPSQKAVKTALAAAVAGLFDIKGTQDCSANPNYPAASKGDVYGVSVAGKIGGASGITVEAGDTFVAFADNAGGTQAGVGTSWVVQQNNIVGALTTADLGVTVQAYSALLAGLAAVGSPAADKMVYLTSATAWAAIATTTFGRSLLNAADAAALRTLAALGAIATEAASVEAPTAARAARFTATAGLLRGALSGYNFNRNGLGSGATGTMFYGNSNSADLIVPTGWKFDIYAISMHVATDPNNAQTVTLKLLVDAVDVSSNHPALLITGTAGVDTTLNASVDCSPFPYTVDATGGTKRVNISMVNGAGAASNASATIYGCLYKP